MAAHDRAPMAALPGAPLGVTAPFLLAVLTLAFTLRPLDDFDVWYHLAAGRLMLATGTWPATNTFAFTTPDHPWVDLHWLFQLLLYGAWAVAGPNGCILLAALLVLGTVAVLYATARRYAAPAVVLFLLAFALAIASPRLVPRPELVGFVLLAIFLWVLDGYPRTGRRVYALPLLQVVWSNAHGTVPIGVGLAACYWLGATLALLPVPAGWRASRCSPAEWRRLTLAVLLCVLACFSTPWGIAGALLPVELLGAMSGGSVLAEWIGEFRPPFEVGLPVIARAWVVMLVLTAASFLLNVRRWRLGQLVAVLVFGLLSTRAFRNVALFVWVAVPAIAANAGGWWTARQQSAAGVRARAAGLTVAVAVALFAAFVMTNRFSKLLNLENEFGLGVSRLRVPDEAFAFARGVGLGERPFNCFSVGGYLAWSLFPAQHIFIDGRTQAYPESFFREYFHVFEDPRAWNALADRYGADWAFLYHYWADRHPLVRYMAAGHGWRLVYFDETTSLFVRDDEAHREMRERAQRAFATRLERRQSEPAPVQSWWYRIALPIEEAQRQSAYGDFLYALDNYGGAIVAYERALALEPGMDWARYALGIAAWRSGDRGRAVREWRAVVARDPGNTRARKALADAAKAGVDVGAASR